MTALSTFSSELASLVETAGKSAVGVEARHRIGSSGFLWKPGIIVTSAHTIRREENIAIVLPDGGRGSAALAGIDYGTDLAVLKLDSASGPELTAAPQLRAGELIVAVGRHRPGVLALTGMVSTAGGPWATWRGSNLDALLRLDIGAYPRSSGSAIFDTHGRFAGMLTTGLTRTAPLAIPAATIDRVATELAEHGRIARGYLGVGLQAIPLPPAFAKALGRDQRSAVMVLSVEPDGPAQAAGFLPGDVIAEIAGQPITDTDDLHAALQGTIGRELLTVVFRSGTRTELKVKVGERRK